MLHSRNPDTLSNTLSEKAIELAGVDEAIYVLSRALEQTCNRLVNNLGSFEAKHLAHQARDYASNSRKMAQEARDTQIKIDNAN